MEFNEWPFRSDLKAACLGIDQAQSYENTMASFHTPHNIPTHLVDPLRETTQSLLKTSIERWPALHSA
jgi:hypothetical protein